MNRLQVIVRGVLGSTLNELTAIEAFIIIPHEGN
jgi:hypothetical protein